MKRIIAIILVMMLLTSSVSIEKVQALPVAIAASSASVMAMIIGLIPYLGVLFNSEHDRQTNIANIENLVTDEMAKTNVNVQEIASFTSANDSNASNGTILQNFLNDNAVMMAMETGTGDNYVQTYFTGVGQSQLFVKAILAMTAVMLADDNLDTYTITTLGTGVGYQKWSGYPASPVLTSVLPYQVIYNNGGARIFLWCTQTYIEMNGTTLNTPTLPYAGNKRYELVNGSWSLFSSGGTGGYMANPIYESNTNIWNIAHNAFVFSKTTTQVQDESVTLTPVYIAPTVQIPYQTTDIWDETASISVPDVATALDVMEGTKTVAEVMDTYTAEGAIPMTGTIAGTLAGTVTAPAEVGEWSKENWTVPALITTKFPFCIPWDLTNTFTSMVATAEPPMWEIDFPSNIFFGGGSMTIDLAQFETLAKIVRWSTMILFLIGLMLLSWRLKGS